jgi:hypothetical protein
MLQRNFLREISSQFLFRCSLPGTPRASIRTQTLLHERKLPLQNFRTFTPFRTKTSLKKILLPFAELSHLYALPCNHFTKKKFRFPL